MIKVIKTQSCCYRIFDLGVSNSSEDQGSFQGLVYQALKDLPWDDHFGKDYWKRRELQLEPATSVQSATICFDAWLPQQPKLRPQSDTIRKLEDSTRTGLNSNPSHFRNHCHPTLDSTLAHLDQHATHKRVIQATDKKRHPTMQSIPKRANVFASPTLELSLGGKKVTSREQKPFWSKGIRGKLLPDKAGVEQLGPVTRESQLQFSGWLSNAKSPPNASPLCQSQEDGTLAALYGEESKCALLLSSMHWGDSLWPWHPDFLTRHSPQ